MGDLLLTDIDFQPPGELGAAIDVLPEVEWLANLANDKTRRAYRTDVIYFGRFLGINSLVLLRQAARSHVIAWRKHLEGEASPSTIRRKLAALSSLYAYLLEKGVVDENPVSGVQRPVEHTDEGKTPALSYAQARLILDAPDTTTLKGKRDSAILAALLYHGMRCEELVKLRVKDRQVRQGVPHFAVQGKGGKRRYLPVHPLAMQRIGDYLDAAGHRRDKEGALFRPVKNNVSGTLVKPLSTRAVYDIVRLYGERTGVTDTVPGLCVHSTRATAATNALDHEADIAKVQDWLGHASIATTRLYDRRRSRPADSPTFCVQY